MYIITALTYCIHFKNVPQNLNYLPSMVSCMFAISFHIFDQYFDINQSLIIYITIRKIIYIIINDILLYRSYCILQII